MEKFNIIVPNQYKNKKTEQKILFYLDFQMIYSYHLPFYPKFYLLKTMELMISIDDYKTK